MHVDCLTYAQSLKSIRTWLICELSNPNIRTSHSFLFDSYYLVNMIMCREGMIFLGSVLILWHVGQGQECSMVRKWIYFIMCFKGSISKNELFQDPSAYCLIVKCLCSSSLTSREQNVKYTLTIIKKYFIWFTLIFIYHFYIIKTLWPDSLYEELLVFMFIYDPFSPNFVLCFHIFMFIYFTFNWCVSV